VRKKFILPERGKWLLTNVWIYLSILSFQRAECQTSGTLTFSVTTTEPSGGYSGKHVIALWIKDASGNFVKTKVKYAATRLQYLNQWVSNSGNNVVDAVTGATLTSHGTLTFTWNGTNSSSSLVPDGVYAVWMQMADANSNGPVASVLFTKGTAETTVTPPDNGNFTNMSLKWVPLSTAIKEVPLINAIKIYPTLTDGVINIDCQDKNKDISVRVVDSKGIQVFRQNFSVINPGIFRINLANLTDGAYVVKVKSGNGYLSSKILINHSY
jgi:hypothetical protein